jgi:hypothetical protein
MKLGYEARDQVGAFDEKKVKNLVQVYIPLSMVVYKVKNI